MYEELVKKIRALTAQETRIGLKTQAEAADAIEELQQMVDIIISEVSKEQPKWIPVTERLPKYGDWVLGIGPKKGYHVCEYRGITHFPYSGDIPWFSAKGRSLNITHWQPLPEPPKEETE